MAEAGDNVERSNKRKRCNILQKRVTDAELSAFTARAAEAGFSRNVDYLAALIAGKEGFDRQDRTDLIRALGELGKHGSNLNQIAHAANSGKLNSLTSDQMKSIEEARKAVSDAAQELREALQ
jgi:hypothetical protein